MSNQIARNRRSNYNTATNNQYALLNQLTANTTFHEIVWESPTINRMPQIVQEAGGRQFRVVTEGVYKVDFNIAWDSNSTGERICYTDMGGLVQVGYQKATAITGSVSILSSSHTAYLNVGDIISIYSYQNSGVGLNVNNLSKLAVTYLG